MTDKDIDIFKKEKDLLPNDEEIKQILSKQKNLSHQSLKTIEDPSSISPLTK